MEKNKIKNLTQALTYINELEAEKDARIAHLESELAKSKNELQNTKNEYFNRWVAQSLQINNKTDDDREYKGKSLDELLSEF